MATYYVILTDHGAAKLAAVATGGTFDITQLVIGDANNLPYLPESRINATALVHERARINLDSVTIVDSNKIQVIARIPANVGGFNQHEIGLLDSAGQLVYVGNYTGAYKSLIGEGASGETALEIDIITSGVGDVIIEINPSFTYAEQAWVDERYVSKLSRAGTVFYHAAKTAPVGSLKANGACVLVASYPALTAAIYCGDALNSSVIFGFRCTDNTGTTRSTTGAYIRLPNLRGEFLRGWDDGHEIDMGRVFGSFQDSTLITQYAGKLGLGDGNEILNSDGVESNKPTFTRFEATVGSYGDGVDYLRVRPRNIALLACIYY